MTIFPPSTHPKILVLGLKRVSPVGPCKQRVSSCRFFPFFSPFFPFFFSSFFLVFFFRNFHVCALMVEEHVQRLLEKVKRKFFKMKSGCLERFFSMIDPQDERISFWQFRNFEKNPKSLPSSRPIYAMYSCRNFNTFAEWFYHIFLFSESKFFISNPVERRARSYRVRSIFVKIEKNQKNLKKESVRSDR